MLRREDVEEVCWRGLSAVRPLTAAARAQDPEGWNFGSAWPPSHFAFGRMRALLTLRAAQALKPASVFEVAAGDAALCASLASPHCRVVANDLREENLRRSTALFTNGAAIELAPGNLFELDPDRLGQFDLVAACDVIEHVAHPDALVQHLSRFVGRGGKLLLTTPNGGYFRNRLPTLAQIADFDALEEKQFRPDADGHLFLLTAAEVETLAAQAGLEVESLWFWATPAITGHGRLSRLSSRALLRVCWGLESGLQSLPPPLRRRLAFHLIAILRHR